MIRKILFKGQNKTQFYIALLGAFVGFVFLTTSIHYLIRIKEFGKNEEILNNKGLIIQKKVSSLSSLNLVKTDFSPKDIEKLKNEDFTQDVQPILNNNFDVSIQTDSKLLPYFRSDIFVQAIDAEFLNISTFEWQWEEGEEYVPIILPRDFLVMINTFASAKGLPQISEELAKNVSFKFNLSNGGKRATKKVKIIDFTGEITSILVPPSFLEYGNQNFASDKESKVTQLLVAINKGTFGQFESYMKSNGLESKESSMIIGKLKSIATLLFLVLMSISTIIIILASLVLIQYAQVLVAHNRYEISTLLRIGYSPIKITKTMTGYFIQVFALTATISWIAFMLSKTLIDEKMLQSGIAISRTYTLQSILALLFVVVIYIALNYWNTKKEVIKNSH